MVVVSLNSILQVHVQFKVQQDRCLNWTEPDFNIAKMKANALTVTMLWEISCHLLFIPGATALISFGYVPYPLKTIFCFDSTLSLHI